MSEIRKDPISNRWVIFSPERSYRPDSYKEDKNKEANPDNESWCPFCEGREKKSGHELLAYEKIPGREPDAEGWWVRVLENKYPALHDEMDLGKKAEGIYDMMRGYGRHEIVVETSEHKKCLSELTYKEVQKIIWAYKERFLEIKKDINIKYVLIFKNYGREAGASLEHSHSQIIATPVVPKKVDNEIQGAVDYHKFRDRCVFCDIITQELSDGRRIIEENEDFVSISFFAGRFPYETWILPKEHNSRFEDLTKNQIVNLSKILKNTLTRINIALNNPNYNYVIHTSPTNIERSYHKYYHWHIEIMPKLTRVAGFEWGTGFYINPVMPEDAAKTLREVEIKEE